MKHILTVLTLSLIPSAAPAWIAQNDLVVRETPGGFTVPFRGLSAARDFWCAAGDYVIRELQLPPATTIYRTSSPPRRAGNGISFSLSAENAKRPGLILLSGRRGVSASFAREMCNEIPEELE
ncbi:MAG: hypothetical protein AAGK71_09880 [Pseudomonadota bacterium]